MTRAVVLLFRVHVLPHPLSGYSLYYNKDQLIMVNGTPMECYTYDSKHMIEEALDSVYEYSPSGRDT